MPSEIKSQLTLRLKSMAEAEKLGIDFMDTENYKRDTIQKELDKLLIAVQ